MKEVAKLTLPVPSGRRILETYGNVIRGKINEDILSRAFITKFNFIDFFLFIYALLYFANFIFFSFGNFMFMRILSKINFSPIQNIMNFKKP